MNEMNQATVFTKWLVVDDRVITVIDLFGRPLDESHVVRLRSTVKMSTAAGTLAAAADRPGYPRVMAVSAADLLKQVLALPEDERNNLVAELIAHVPAREECPEVDSPEWVTEIERRARRVLTGESAADDWEVVEQRVLARLSDE